MSKAFDSFDKVEESNYDEDFEEEPKEEEEEEVSSLKSSAAASAKPAVRKAPSAKSAVSTASLQEEAVDEPVEEDDYSQEGFDTASSVAARKPSTSTPAAKATSQSAASAKPFGRSSVVSNSFADSLVEDAPASNASTPRGGAPANPAASTHSFAAADDDAKSTRSTRSRAQSAKGVRSAAPIQDSMHDSWEGELGNINIVRMDDPAPPPSKQQQVQQPQRQQQPPRPSSAHSQRSYASSMHSGSLVGSLVHSPPPAPRARPSSAAPHDRQAAALSDLTRRHPGTWDVRDVAMWVDYIGLGQYRKKFTHNCIDGRLLLAMTDAQLKSELGIGPMGHRAALLDAVRTLASEAEDMEAQSASPSTSPQRGRGRPASARPASYGSSPPAADKGPRRPASASKPGIIPPGPYLGPALGKVTVYEQRAKLLFELDRAAARAAQHRALTQQLQHQTSLSEHEVAHLQGLLQDLERKNKVAVTGAVGGLDSKARIPWRPSSARPPMATLEKPGIETATLSPKMSPASRRIMGEAYGGGVDGKQSTFLDRLETDARKRDRARNELDRKYYSVEAMMGDPMLVKKKGTKDWQFVAQYFQDKGIVDGPFSSREGEYETQINDAVEQYASEWKIKDGQAKAILEAKGQKKLALIAAALRTLLFMMRYESELTGRDQRLRELQKHWWETAMGRPKQQKEQEDMDQLNKYFEMLGWKGEDAVSDTRLDALLRRVVGFKQAYEKWRDQQASGGGGDLPNVDWNASPWSSDGLGPLAETAAADTQAALERGGAAAAAGDNAGVAKTAHAPGGAVSVGPATDAGMDYLNYTVRLLARARWDDLEKCQGWSGTKKQLGVYRHIRAQKFLEFTEREIQSKERKLQVYYEAMQKQSRVISGKEMTDFFERLLDDAAKRKANADKLVSDKLAKEDAIRASSNLYSARPRTAR